MRVFLFLAWVWCAVLAAPGQTQPRPAEVRSLSLRECIDLALARNLDLRIARMSAQIAGYELGGSYGAYDPLFSFQARHDSITSPANVDPKKENLYLPYNLDYDTIGPKLEGRLPTGLSYELGATAGGQTAVTDLRLDPGAAAAYPGGIRTTNNFGVETAFSARQHLLKDFWTDEYRETISIRRKDLKISEQALRFQIMRTALAVELGFYDLMAAREKVGVEENALELRRQFVQETRRRVEVGDLPPLDNEQAEAQLQNTQTALTAARELLVDRQNTLAGLIADNLLEWADIDLEPSGRLFALPEEVNRAASYQKALGGRPDLIQARLEVEKNDVVVGFRFNQLFPSLDLIGSYGSLSSEPDQSAAFDDALHSRNPVYYYGTVVSFPLANVAARNGYKASKTTREVARLQLKKAEQGVLLQVAEAVNRVQSRFSQTDSTRQARAYAESALSAEQKKLENGLTTSFVVLQYQQILIDARNAEIQALADYNSALAQWAFAEGSSLDRNRLLLRLK